MSAEVSLLSLHGVCNHPIDSQHLRLGQTVMPQAVVSEHGICFVLVSEYGRVNLCGAGRSPSPSSLRID